MNNQRTWLDFTASCTGCSPVNCPSCGRQYKSKGSLNRHRKFECGQEPAFSCPICFIRFKRKDKLKDHHDRHHRQDPPIDSVAAIQHQSWTLSSPWKIGTLIYFCCCFLYQNLRILKKKKIIINKRKKHVWSWINASFLFCNGFNSCSI